MITQLKAGQRWPVFLCCSAQAKVNAAVKSASHDHQSRASVDCHRKQVKITGEQKICLNNTEELPMKESLQSGLTFTHRYPVPREKTVQFVFPESDLFQAMPAVFATAFMVGLMEWACMEALRPFMDDGEISLGTNICVSHAAATPPGMQVEVDVTLLEVSGSRTKWSIVARDEREVIGEGTHERFTINREKFAAIVAKKM
jgi:fluoroacetyl-CoA thioesterase